MSNIDLSQAKVGDKFRMRSGNIITYYECKKYKHIYYYLLKGEDGRGLLYYKNGKFLLQRDTEYDLVEQVFDKPLDELIEEATKQFRENDDAIAEENELQRRQEVMELAEKMYIMFENEKLRYHLNRDGSDNFCSENLREMAIIRAASFIKKKHNYLKDGKLC